jgi:hypothetical protein
MDDLVKRWIVRPCRSYMIELLETIRKRPFVFLTHIQTTIDALQLIS